MAALPSSGTVISEDGIEGWFEAESQGSSRVLVKFANGRQLVAPAEELIRQVEGHYRLPVRVAALAGTDKDGTELHVIPVMAETLKVSKRQVITGGVRVTKVVREHEDIVDEPLLRETVAVERVAVNQLIDQPATVRYENDTVIVPIMEEVLVVERRLLLKEEVHIRRMLTTTHQPQTVVRRSEEVVVERFQYPKPEDHSS